MKGLTFLLFSVLSINVMALDNVSITVDGYELSVRVENSVKAHWYSGDNRYDVVRRFGRDNEEIDQYARNHRDAFKVKSVGIQYYCSSSSNSISFNLGNLVDGFSPITIDDKFKSAITPILRGEVLSRDSSMQLLTDSEGPSEVKYINTTVLSLPALEFQGEINLNRFRNCGESVYLTYVRNGQTITKEFFVVMPNLWDLGPDYSDTPQSPNFSLEAPRKKLTINVTKDSNRDAF